MALLLRQFLYLNIFPSYFYAAAFMYLQSNKTFTLGYFFISQVAHHVAVKPGSNMAAISFNFIGIPFTFFQVFFMRRVWLNKPASSIRFINAAGMLAHWRNFCLPSAYGNAFRNF